MTALKVERIGDRLTIEAPAGVMDRLGLKAGPLYLHDLGQGDFLLSNAPDEASLQFELGEGVMNDFDQTFVTLAK